MGLLCAGMEGGRKVSEVFTTAKGLSVVVHDDSIRVVYGIADEETIYLSQEDKTRLINIIEPQPVLQDIKFEDIKKGDELRTKYYKDGKVVSICFGTTYSLNGTSSRSWLDENSYWVISEELVENEDYMIIDVMKRTWEELPVENGSMIVVWGDKYSNTQRLVRIANAWRDLSTGAVKDTNSIYERGWKRA